MSAYLGSTPTNVLEKLFQDKQVIALYRGSTLIQSFGLGEFSPWELFADGKQGVWYDPSDKSTLFQDVAGTVPVTKDGDPVALMRDKSGNGNHATQTVSAARPAYKTDGILHWLEFDGADDHLFIKAMPVIPQPFSFAMAKNEIVSSRTTRYLSSSTGGILRYSTNTWRIGFGTGFVDETIPSIQNAKVMIFTSNYADSDVLTATETHTMTGGNGSISGDAVIWADSNSSTSYAAGSLYQIVLATTLTTDDKANLKRYLSGKAGVTL